MGSPRTLVHEAIFAISDEIQTLAADATVNGASFDRANTLNAAHELVVLVDVGLWVDGTHSFHLEESVDDSVWTNVAAADVIVGDPLSGLANDGAATVTAGVLVIEAITTDNTQYLFGYMGDERYVRLSIDSTATTTGLADVVSWFVGANPRDNVR